MVVSSASREAGVACPLGNPLPLKNEFRMARPHLVTEPGARHVEQRVQIILGATFHHRCKIDVLSGRLGRVDWRRGVCGGERAWMVRRRWGGDACEGVFRLKTASKIIGGGDPAVFRCRVCLFRV